MTSHQYGQRGARDAEMPCEILTKVFREAWFAAVVWCSWLDHLVTFLRSCVRFSTITFFLILVVTAGVGLKLLRLLGIRSESDYFSDDSESEESDGIRVNYSEFARNPLGLKLQKWLVSQPNAVRSESE